MGIPAVQTLTDKQARFAHLVASGHRQTEAARLAGYVAAPQDAYKLMRLPHVLAAIEQERTRVIEGELAPAALRMLGRILDDTGPPTKLHVEAARVVLLMTRHGKPASAAPVDPVDVLASMSPDELRAHLAQLREVVVQADQLRSGGDSAPTPGATIDASPAEAGKSIP